jgi:erythromycin esterase
MAIPFDTAERESGFGDLESFRAIVGDARIVALGEATHGTSEFFTMKHRLTELLVTELGFTIFAIEAPWPATKVINWYVHTGDATRSQLVDGLSFWVWQTREVLDLIEWIHDYNMRPGVNPVSFQGFDMQVGLDDHAVNQVLAFVAEVDRGAVERFAAYYAAIPHDQSVTPADANVAGTQAALDDLLGHADEYSAVPSSEPYEDIVQTARMIVQSEELLATGLSSASFELRDRHMADNVSWLLDRAGPASKIVLWAHNAHVAAAALAAPDGTALRGMGSRLREHYGDELIVAGFDFFSGTFNAIGQDPDLAPSAEPQWVHEVPLPLPESVEYTLAQLGLPRFMLDLRFVEAGTPTGDWLIEERPMWSIGAAYSPTMLDNVRIVVNLPHHFDVLIYFQETSASQRLF